MGVVEDASRWGYHHRQNQNRWGRCSLIRRTHHHHSTPPAAASPAPARLARQQCRFVLRVRGGICVERAAAVSQRRERSRLRLFTHRFPRVVWRRQRFPPSVLLLLLLHLSRCFSSSWNSSCSPPPTTRADQRAARPPCRCGGDTHRTHELRGRPSEVTARRRRHRIPPVASPSPLSQPYRRPSSSHPPPPCAHPSARRRRRPPPCRRRRHQTLRASTKTIRRVMAGTDRAEPDHRLRVRHGTHGHGSHVQLRLRRGSRPGRPALPPPLTPPPRSSPPSNLDCVMSSSSNAVAAPR